MEDVDTLGNSIAAIQESCPSRVQAGPHDWPPRPAGKDVRRTHGAKVADQAVQGLVTDLDPVQINHGHRESGLNQQLGQGLGLDSGMDVRTCLAGYGVGGEHCLAQPRKAVASCNRADQQPAIVEQEMQCGGSKRQIVGGLEYANANAQVELSAIDGQRFEIGDLPASKTCHHPPRLDHGDAPGCKPFRPFRIGAAGKKDLGKVAMDVVQSLQAIFEGAVVKERLDANPRRPITAVSPKAVVE